MITIPIMLSVKALTVSSTKMDRFVYTRHLCIIINTIHFDTANQ
jgi:hypothetical protein